MVLQKRFIVVFTSKDGIIFHRAVVWDSNFFNSAFIGNSTLEKQLNAGKSFIQASNLMREINNLKNGHTATIRDYSAFKDIPAQINIGL